MKVDQQIKKYRANLNLSQEELADKIYVSRQTISNWERGKSYPDIHSLILMSSLFGVSLDQLIKGDLEIMKETIKTSDIKEFNFYSTIYSIALCTLIISIAPTLYFFKHYGFFILIILLIINFILAFKVEKLKKAHDVQTYKEIVAFMDGRRLDEISKNQEFGKRPYQKFLLACLAGVITFVVTYLMFIIFFK